MQVPQTEQFSQEEVKPEILPVIEVYQPERDPFAPGEAVAAGEKKPVAAGHTQKKRDPFRPKSFAAETVETEWEAAGEVTVENVQEDINLPVLEGLVLELSALDRCWLDVFVDGQRVLRTNVPAREYLHWQGKQVELARGRAWAVQVTVNGQELGLLENLVAQLENGFTVPGVEITLSASIRAGFCGSTL